MLKRLLNIVLLFIGVLVWPAVDYASANEIPYWAGYKYQLTTDETSGTNTRGLPATLNIEYSDDGRTYKASWHYDFKDGGIGQCTGRVDQTGKLETTDCTPDMKNQTRELGGTVFQIEITGGYWGEPVWRDENLKKNKAKLLALAATRVRSLAGNKKQTGQGTTQVAPPALPSVLEGLGFAEDHFGDRHPVNFVLKKKAHRYVVSGTLVVEGETFGLECGELTLVAAEPFSFERKAKACTSDTHTVSRTRYPHLTTSGRVLHLSSFRIGEYGAYVTVEESRITLLYGADLAQFRAQSKRQKGLSSAAYLKIANARRVAAEEKQKVEAERRRIQEESAAKKRLRALTAKLAALEAVNRKLESKRKRKMSAAAQEKKRKAALAAQEAKRKAEAEKKLKAALARKKAEAKRKAEAEKKLREKNEKLYASIENNAVQYLSDVQAYVTQNPGLPTLLETVIASSNVKKALSTKNGVALRNSIESLELILLKDQTFTKFRSSQIAHREKKRRDNIAKLQHELDAYVAFLEKTIALNLATNINLSIALVPLAKELKKQKSTNKISVLTNLKLKVSKALKLHGLKFDLKKATTLKKAQRKGSTKSMVANLQTGPKNFPAKKKAGTIGQPIVLENLKIVISMAGPWKKELGDGFTSFEARQNESAFPVIMKIRNTSGKKIKIKGLVQIKVVNFQGKEIPEDDTASQALAAEEGISDEIKEYLLPKSQLVLSRAFVARDDETLREGWSIKVIYRKHSIVFSL